MRRPHRILALAAAAVLGLSACKDSTGSDNRDDASVSFQYSGFASGSFDASGSSTTQSSTHPDFAAALRDTVDGVPYVAVFGFQPLSNGRTSLVDLEMVDPNTPSTISLDVDCGTSASQAGCGAGLIGINWDFTTQSSVAGEQAYFVESGTLVVTQISSSRVKGTFSGQASDENGNLINISGGSFDVPFVNSSSLFFASAPANPPLLPSRALPSLGSRRFRVR
jgi:hypothetical protein